MATKNEFKIIINGNSGTGKTSYSNRWIKNSYSVNYEPTLFGDFATKNIEIDNVKYKIQLFDLPGEDNEANFTKIFVKNAQGCIILSDTKNIKNSENIKNFRLKVKENSKFMDGGEIPCILVENQSDKLKEDSEYLKYESQLKKLGEENDFDGTFLVSARNGKNINESMEFLIKQIIKRKEIYEKKQNDNKIIEKKNNEENIDISNKIKLNKIDDNLLNLSLSIDEIEYKHNINIDELKEEYNILKSIKNAEDFIDIISILLKKKKVKINLIIKKIIIQISILFTSLTGDEVKILFDLTPENIDNKKLNKYLIETLIEKDEKINKLTKENEELKKKLNI